MPIGVYIRSQETKDILSRAKLGSKGNATGKRWKIDPEKLLKRSLKRGNNTGNKHTDEVKNKISETKKAQVTEETREHCRKIGLKGRLTQFNQNGFTKIEIIVKDYLTKNNIEFIPQYVVDDRWFCDFYLSKYNLILECDGDYWHNLNHVKVKDRVKNAYLLEKGYNLLRLSEQDIKNGNYILIFNEKLKTIESKIDS